MEYKCPRCGRAIRRGGGGKVIEGMEGWSAGSLFSAAFGSFQCYKCGKIERREFPPEVRRRILMGTVFLAIAATVVFAVGIWCVWLL